MPYTTNYISLRKLLQLFAYINPRIFASFAFMTQSLAICHCQVIESSALPKWRL